MKSTDVTKLMAELYFDEAAARSLLIQISFPPDRIPRFEDAQSFWARISVELDHGIVRDGLAEMMAIAAQNYPGNPEVQALHAQLSGVSSGTRASGKSISAEGPCPTLMLIGADLPDEFLEVVRGHLGTDAPDLLYVSKQQCAVAIPDPGDQAAQLQQQIQELMQTHAPGADLQVVYEKYNFRPYLYSALEVFGPDTTPYLLQAVPATTKPSDIASAIVEETLEAMTNRKGETVSTVIDAETEDGPKRLDPDKTLHENKVKDKGRLRIGTKAIAGNISPELRMEAQLRIRAQIRRYAFGREGFDIVGYDNEDLPNQITFEIEGPGLAPPPDLADFLAGTENLTNDDFRNLPWERLNPVRIDLHRFTMTLLPMFPVEPPYVVWETPVFHPNIWRLPQPGVRPGLVCLGPLMDGWRPDLDFGYLCQLLLDIGTYQNYDVVETNTYPDPPAAFWARTEAGQRVIQEIGGPPMRATTQPRSERTRPPALHVKPMHASAAGKETRGD